MLKAILLCAMAARADTTTQDADVAAAVYAEIKPQASASSLACLADSCVITYTPKPGTAVAFTDRRARLNAARALAQKWADGTITAAEKDALLKALVLRLLKMD